MPERLRIANAPCSFGAFELTLDMPGVPDPVDLLDAVAAAGYDGIDLGPVGFLGDAEQLRERLAARELGLAGGYLELPFGAGASFAEMRDELEAMLDLFELAGGETPPRPTLADAGSAARRARPGQAQAERSLGLDEDGWKRFAETLAEVVERCRQRDFEPTFHPHAGTYVEVAWEIEELIARSDVGLCLDSGHLVVGGVEPLAALREWGPRINHLHLKDVDRDALERGFSAGDSLDALFQRRIFCPLGDGDVALTELCAEIVARDFDGWLVVEQDVFPEPGGIARAVRDQEANRRYLRGLGL